MSQGYNGWTNYETWCVNLWIENEEGSQADLLERAEEAYRDAEGDVEAAAIGLADSLKEEYESAESDVLERAGVENSVWADLLSAALSEVSWHEIAKNAIDSLDTEALDAERAED